MRDEIILEAMNTEEMVIKKLKTFSPEKQQEVLKFMEFLEFRYSKQVPSESPDRDAKTALEAAGNLVGCLEAPSDLSTNKDYLKGFGQ